MPKQMQARPIEILSITAGKLVMRPTKKEKTVILITYRPDPANSHRSEIVAVTPEQAQRLHEDLGTILDAASITWECGPTTKCGDHR